MEITTRTENDILIISLKGKIQDNYDELNAQLLALTKNNKKIIIECSKLTYITSLALRSFLMMLKTISKDEGKLAFCQLKNSVKDIFKLTGFIHLFVVYNTLEEAIENIQINE